MYSSLLNYFSWHINKMCILLTANNTTPGAVPEKQMYLVKNT